MLRSVNPYDQSVIATFDEISASEVDRRIALGWRTFEKWRQVPMAERAALMKRAGQVLRERKEMLASLITGEMGKVLAESRAEIEKCANACDYFAGEADGFLRNIPVNTEASASYVAFQPLGPVLAIMPWNFPFWQVFRFAAPAMMAGNAGLLKHAANVSQCALAIEAVFLAAGFPEGVFQTLLVEASSVAGIIARDEVRAVTLTGSESAGVQVASAAGKNLKRTVLELGGSDPFIVLADADVELAAKVATQSRMQNAGQSCIAAKRFIVVESIKESFLSKFISHVKNIRQGNPTDPTVTMGPMARLDLAEEVEKQVQSSVAEGAQVVTGGVRVSCNFQPTILDSVRPGMKAFDEEIFGPVASVITVRDEAEAIAMANKSRYGLGASVWTRDLKAGERVALELESGCVFVNSLMRSDQRLPFGGVKKSGYGRELSELGIKEFVNAKTVYVA